MRKESRVLILIALLLANSSHIGAQDEDFSDSDLETLLDDKPKEVKEVSEAPEPVEETATTTTKTVEKSEPVSSETVDLEALEDSTQDVAVETPAAPETPTASEQPVETAVGDTEDIDLDALENLPDDSVTPIEKPKASEKIAEPTKPQDDLDSIMLDAGEEKTPTETAKKAGPTLESEPNMVEAPRPEPSVFDVGKEERELISIAQNIQGQITDTEWSEVATAAKVDTYTIVKDDWLFKISKRLFGSGYYYPKIWSLNSFITNPHFVEPGMLLSFTTGSASQAPEVKIGSFTSDELAAAPGSIGNTNPTDLSNFGEDTIPEWMNEKKQLESQGVYFQYASEETMDDLTRAGELALNREYENYEPPRNEFDIILPKNYDKSGFDKNSRIYYSVKQGFYLRTFVSTNIVQDFGSITNGPDENIFFTKTDRAYVQFDETMNVLPGDRFSVYSSGGKVSHPNSDRQGYKYSIIGQIKTIRKIKNKWEVEFIEVSGTPQRGDRITAYTPKIERITRTYNSRMIEAAILGSFQPMQTIMGFGDVIYLDRGRADGVEMGNVFDVYGFKDRALDKAITDQPTYKLGELVVITLTDNFATALVTKSNRDFYAGNIAITKTKESYLRELHSKQPRTVKEKTTLGGKALEELDVELNLENLNDNLLKEADKIQLTEDELAELERQEREKSVIKDSEKDLKSLERLENEIENAETILNDAKLDEDKLLEQQNLNEIEKKHNGVDQDSLEDIEENLGKRYVDEDLNSKDNPYGLTEFDVEEVDELLNVEKKEQNNQ